MGDCKFQSTRPVRGATHPVQLPVEGHGISIHAPRAGRDWGAVRARCVTCSFQSTRPVRGATRPLDDLLNGDAISIHAPRAGRDHPLAWDQGGRPYFNPRAPCGARLTGYNWREAFWTFQSTRPVRGATSSSVSRPP